ncbi:hypothetical protein UFOVP233_55 [uncultured Caudovirales phage]|uniref:Uncharacterized protein n=1 Tax=uncultured Caudovirales phage TaxID=2100421 RepID=A0A6J7WW40_9CAUD|nr:hypothetical protein UFOVP233_55 [uncultured Caudovirales phage]
MSFFADRISAIAKRADEILKEGYKPPEGVRSNAKRGLELRRKYGRGGLTNAEASDQGIGSGVQRATNLANGDAVSLDTIKRMHAFFERQEKNKDTPPEEGNGKIAWLLWGGDAGRRWADAILRRESILKRTDALISSIAKDGEAPAGDGPTVSDVHVPTADMVVGVTPKPKKKPKRATGEVNG